MASTGRPETGYRDAPPVVVAGDGLLKPVVLAAVALLLVNDHLLKGAWPGWLTGKLSDFAGLVFFPLLLQALWEVAASAAGRSSLASGRVLALSIMFTLSAFSAIQVSPAASEAYGWALGTAQWLVGSVLDALSGGSGVPLQRALNTPDPTDLAALPVLAVPYLVGRGRRASLRAEQASGGATRLPRPPDPATG